MHLRHVKLEVDNLGRGVESGTEELLRPRTSAMYLPNQIKSLIISLPSLAHAVPYIFLEPFIPPIFEMQSVSGIKKLSQRRSSLRDDIEITPPGVMFCASYLPHVRMWRLAKMQGTASSCYTKAEDCYQEMRRVFRGQHGTITRLP